MQAVQVVIQVARATSWSLGVSRRWWYSWITATDGVQYAVTKRADSDQILPSPGQLCKLELCDNKDLLSLRTTPTYCFTIL